MALRLIVESQDRIQRHCLIEGENRLGSSPGSGVRIAHPSVSRRHAMIFVCEGKAEIEDLGSRNGTRLNGRRVSRRCQLDVGETLTFGSVEARLEEVSEKDLEAAVTFGSRAPERPEAEPGTESPVMTTLRLGSLQTFTLELLPELLVRLSEKPGAVRMAQCIGEALVTALPCLEVEIVSASQQGLIYKGSRKSARAAEPKWATAENAVCTIRAGFLNSRQASTYQPLLESAGMFVSLAARTNGAGGDLSHLDSPVPRCRNRPRCRRTFAGSIPTPCASRRVTWEL